MDMFDRLPLRMGWFAGVAPDHQKDKSVTRAYEKALHLVSAFGNVEWHAHPHDRPKGPLPSSDVYHR